MDKKWRKGALVAAGTLALVFFNRLHRGEIFWVAIPIALLLFYGLSGWITKNGLSPVERIGRTITLAIFCSGAVFVYAWHFWADSTVVADRPSQPVQLNSPNSVTAPSQDPKPPTQAERNAVRNLFSKFIKDHPNASAKDAETAINAELEKHSKNFRITVQANRPVALRVRHAKNFTMDNVTTDGPDTGIDFDNVEGVTMKDVHIGIKPISK